MGNEYNVIESGFIKCACGGKVTLTSSVPNLKIAGAKPLYLKDILGAPVACPRSKNKCTKVASNSTAGTETNVSATGLTYLLRTDGFKTDKGRAVILVDPGQSTSKISAPPSLFSQEIVAEEPTEKAIKESEEKKEKEKYKLYLIRSTKDNDNIDIYKPLRAIRVFLKTENFFSVDKDINPRIKDKVYSELESYVYVKTKKSIDEYKIVSRGTLCSENLNEISYKDEQNILKKYIALENDDEVEIVYSNVKLRKAQSKRASDFKKFKAININPKTLESTKEKAFYIKDVQSLASNEITKEDIQTQKKFDPLSKHEKNTKLYPLDIIAVIDDELGVLEDLKEYYEFSFKKNFVDNESIIDDIRDKNAYVYTVANQLNYFYVPEGRKNKYNKNLNKLRKYYSTFVREILYGKLSNLIFEDDTLDLANIVVPNFDMASNYYRQIEFLSKSFFKNMKIELYDGQLKFINNQLNYYYNPKISSTEVESRNNDIKKYAEERGINRTIHTAHGYLKFSNYHNDYKLYREDPNKLLALIVFSILFSGDYDDELRAISDIEDNKLEFYNLIINMRPLPAISEDDIEDVNYKMKDQSLYKEIFEGSTKKSGFIFTKENKDKNTLLSQFDNLEYIHKKVSFSYKEAKKIKIQTALEFEDLYKSKDLSSFKTDDYLLSPDKLLKLVVKEQQNPKIKELLGLYSGIKEFDNEDEKIRYHYNMLNLSYDLTKIIAFMDEELNISSIFNAQSKDILSFMEELAKSRENIEDMNKWAEYRENKKLFFETYSMVTNSVVTHSCIQNGQNDADKKFKERQTNVLEFLNTISKLQGLQTKIDFEFSQEKKKNPNQSYKTLISTNFDMAQKSQDTAEALYSTLSAINGFTKRLNEMNSVLEDIKALKEENKALSNEIKKMKQDKSTRRNIKKRRQKEIIQLIEEKESKISNLGGDILTNKKFGKTKLKTITEYYVLKKTLASTKTLSNVVALMGIVNYYNSYDKLKLSNLTAFASDVSTLSILALEGLEKARNNAKLATTLITQAANKAKLNIGIFAYRLDIFITIITGVNRFVKLDDEDGDGKKITGLTTTLQVIFLLSSSWIGLGTGFILAGLTELAYQLILNFTHIINSPIENYINKSLLYKTKTDDGLKFKTTILNRTLKDSDLRIPQFNTFKDIQNFIGDNYDKNKGMLDSALVNEISVLKKTLFGLDLELFSSRYSIDKETKLYKATRVKIPKQIFDDSKFKLIIKTDKNEYKVMQKPESTIYENFYTYDLSNNDIIEASKISELNHKKYSIIVLTENILLKYNYTYSFKEVVYISVLNFKEAFIDQEDEKFIGTITNE
ncbi:hypothetical protein [Arcobacter sp. F2176]|uniref:hypothetical protein n=1 Tax=Arcobacter sp. F2176 TaxID=2044511 RepID=UPI00100ADC62|nr:hypothetical protein [Arcobacter sp. F2176]RXJ82332.1 hypothetical protein CRU95_02420 [Arcobacter sp. F2176]